MVSEAVTHCIRVRVKAFFLPQHSDLDRRQYLWAYHIRITNEGDTPATLLSRHWIITDARDRVEEVRGHGLLGGIRFKSTVQAGEVMKACTAEKLLTVSAGDNVLRMLPSLTVTEEELKEGVARLGRAINASKPKA